MSQPKLTGREVRKYDWEGWIVFLVACAVIAYALREHSYVLVLPGVLFAWDYGTRVMLGRVYKFVYFDTIIHTMYEIVAHGSTYFVCAESEEELKTYMGIHYKLTTYRVIDKHIVESFIKTNQFL